MTGDAILDCSPVEEVILIYMVITNQSNAGCYDTYIIYNNV
jgi:hypothetical protein